MRARVSRSATYTSPTTAVEPPKTPEEGYTLTADLPNQTLRDEHGLSYPFEISEFRKRVLLEGLDDIGLTLQHEAEISAYEAKHPSWTT